MSRPVVVSFATVVIVLFLLGAATGPTARSPQEAGAVGFTSAGAPRDETLLFEKPHRVPFLKGLCMASLRERPSQWSTMVKCDRSRCDEGVFSTAGSPDFGTPVRRILRCSMLATGCPDALNRSNSACK